MDSTGDDNEAIGGFEEAFGDDQSAIMQYMEEVLGEQFDADFYEELKKTDLFADVLKDFNSGGAGGGSTPGPPGSSSNQSTTSRRSSSENRVAVTSRDASQNQTSGPSRKSQQTKSSTTSVAIGNQKTKNTKKSSEERQERPIYVSEDSLSSSRKASSSSSSAKLKNKKNKEVKSRAILNSSSSSDKDTEDLTQQRRKLQKKLKVKLKIQSSSVEKPPPPPAQKKEKKVEGSVKKEEVPKKRTENKFKSRALLSSSSSSSSSESDNEDLVRQREQLKKKLKEKLKIKPWTPSSSSSSKKDKKIETSVRKGLGNKGDNPVRKVDSEVKPVETPVLKVANSEPTQKPEVSTKKPEKQYRPGPKSKKLSSSHHPQQSSPTETAKQQSLRIPSKDEFNHHSRPSVSASSLSISAEPQARRLPGRRRETLHLMDLVLVSRLFPTEFKEQCPIHMTSKLLEEVRQCEMKYRSRCNNCVHSKPLRRTASLDREIVKKQKETCVTVQEVKKNSPEPVMSPHKSVKTLIKSPVKHDDEKDKKKKPAKMPFGPLSAILKKTERAPATKVTPDDVPKTKVPSPEFSVSPEKTLPKPAPPSSSEDEKIKVKPQPVTFGFDKLSVLNATLSKAKIRKCQDEATVVEENKSGATKVESLKTKAVQDDEKKVPTSAIVGEDKNDAASLDKIRAENVVASLSTTVVEEKKVGVTPVMVVAEKKNDLSLEKDEEATLAEIVAEEKAAPPLTLMDEEKTVPPSVIVDQHNNAPLAASVIMEEENKMDQSSLDSLTLTEPPSKEETVINETAPKDVQEEESSSALANDSLSKPESMSSLPEKVEKLEEGKAEFPSPIAEENADSDSDKLAEIESAELTKGQVNAETESSKAVDPIKETEEETNNSVSVEIINDDNNSKNVQSVPSEPALVDSEEDKKLDFENIHESSVSTTIEVKDNGQVYEDEIIKIKIEEVQIVKNDVENTTIDKSSLQSTDHGEGLVVEETKSVEDTKEVLETIKDKPVDEVSTKKEEVSPSLVPSFPPESEQIETKNEIEKGNLAPAASPEVENQNQENNHAPDAVVPTSSTAADDLAADAVDDPEGPPSPVENDNFADMPSPPHSPAADDSREASSPEEVIGGTSKKSPTTATPKKKAIIESSSDDDHRKEDTTDGDVTPERKKSIDDDDESVVATGSGKKGVRFAIQNPSIERKRDQEEGRSYGKFNEFEMERQRKQDKTKGGKKDKHGKKDPLEDFKKEKLLCSSFRIPKTATPTIKHPQQRIITPLSTVNVPKEKIQFEKFRKGLSDKDSKKDRRDKSGGREWNNNRNFRGGDGDFSSGSQDFRGDQRFGAFDRHKVRDDGKVVLMSGDPEEGGKRDEPFGGSSPPGETVVPEQEPLWANDGEEPGGGDSPPPGPLNDANAEGNEVAGEGEKPFNTEWEDNTVSSGEQVTMKMSDVKEGKLEGTPAITAKEEEESSAALLDPEVEVKDIEVNAFAIGAVMYLKENPEPMLPDVEVETNLAEATMMRVAWWFYKANFENALSDVGSRDDWYKVLMDPDSYGDDDDDAKSNCSFHDKLKWTGSEDEEIYNSLPEELRRRKSNGTVDEYCGRQLLLAEYRTGPGDKFAKIFQLRGSGNPGIEYDVKENFQARCTVCDFLVVGRNKLAFHVLSDVHKEKVSRIGMDNLKTTGKEADKYKEFIIYEEKKTEVDNVEKKRHASGATGTSVERKDESKDRTGDLAADKDKSQSKRSRSRSPTTHNLKRNRSRSPVHRFNHRGGRGRDRSPKRKSRSRSPHDGSGRRRRSRSRDRKSTKERIVREPIVRISRSPRRHRRSPERVTEKTETKSKAQARSRSPSSNRKRYRHDSPPAPSTAESAMLPTHLTNEVDEKMALTLEGKWTDELERKWKVMETEEARFIEQFTKNRKSLQTAPEKHPDYGDAWTAFWERRYQEIEKEGKEDPDKHNFVKEWKEFWTKEMNDILDREYEIEIKEIKKRNGVDIESLRKFRKTKPSTADWKSKSKPRQPPPPPKIQVPFKPVPSPPSAASQQNKAVPLHEQKKIVPLPEHKKVAPLPQQTRPPSLPSVAGTVTPSSPSVSGEEEVNEDEEVVASQPVPILSQVTTVTDAASTSTTVTTSTVDIISTWDKLEKNASFLATSFITQPSVTMQQSPPSYLGSVVSIVPALPTSSSIKESYLDENYDDDVDSKASIESYEFRGGMDVVEVLYRMTKLEEQLGFFGEKIKEFFKSAEEMDLQKRNKSYTLLTDSYFVAVLFQIRERFMSLAQTQILPRDVVDNFNLTINGLNGLLDHPHCQKRRPKVPDYIPHVILPPPPLPEVETHLDQTYQRQQSPMQQPPLPPLPRDEVPYSPPRQQKQPLPPPPHEHSLLSQSSYYYQSQPESPQQRQTDVSTPSNVYDTFTRPTRRSSPSTFHQPTTHQTQPRTDVRNYPHEQSREVNVYDTFTRPSSTERTLSSQLRPNNPFWNLSMDTKQDFATQLTYLLINMGMQDLSDYELRELLWRMSNMSALSPTPMPCAVSYATLEQWRIPKQNRLYSSSVPYHQSAAPMRAAMPEMPNVVPHFHNPRGGPRPLLLSSGYDRRSHYGGGGGENWEYDQRQNIPGNNRDNYMSSNYPSSFPATTDRQATFTRRNFQRNPNFSYHNRDGS